MPQITKHGLDEKVRTIIQRHLEQMEATGKTYFICGRCGKRGPKVAEKNFKTGEVRILLDYNSPKLERWPVIFVKAKANGCSTTMRICPACALKEC